MRFFPLVDFAMVVVATGFGPFGSIDTNPSSEDLNSLRGTISESLRIVTDIPVSVRGADQFVASLDAGDVVVCFGVNAQATTFQVETTAFNEMTFKIPDVDGREADREAIDSAAPARLVSRIAPNVLAALGPLVERSEDPGRYICNYLYFRCLQRTVGNAVFIHVPSYSALPADPDRIRVVRTIISTVL